VLIQRPDLGGDTAEEMRRIGGIMRDASMEHMRRVFRHTLESAGPEQAASELVTQRELADAVYRQGRITKNEYDELIKAFDVIGQELDLLPPQLVAE